MKQLMTILKLKEKQLQDMIVKYLVRLGYTIEQTDDYVYGYVSKSGLLLLAHTDTHNKQPKHIYYDKSEGVLWSPDGLGADDRAGVFGILQIIKNHKVDVLFLAGEEKGGKGAYAFSNIYKDNPGYDMLIELDRKGSNDAVFYDNDSTDFHNHIIGYGFKKGAGTFSDISIIAPDWKVNSVNLSIGYFNEHMKNEYLVLKYMFATISKVGKIIKNGIKLFPYKELVSYHYNWNDYCYFDYCEVCNSDGRCYYSEHHDLYLCTTCLEEFAMEDDKGHSHSIEYCYGCNIYVAADEENEKTLSEYGLCKQCFELESRYAYQGGWI